MEWPSGLRRRLRRTPSPIRTRPRAAFSFWQSRCPEREAAPGAWQIPTGTHMKILPKQTHTSSKPTVLSPTVPQANDLSSRSLNPPKKK